MTTRLPKLVALDLDYTLWPLWIDTHITPPIRREADAISRLVDRHGTEIALYRDVPAILHRLRAAGVRVAACSRTAAPALARRALDLLLVPPAAGGDAGPARAVEYFAALEIYPGSKLAHFRALHKTTGLPYAEMLFFDDERRNGEVEALGVTFCLAPDGLDERTFEKGLDEWRKRHPHEVVEDADGSGAA